MALFGEGEGRTTSSTCTHGSSTGTARPLNSRQTKTRSSVSSGASQAGCGTTPSERLTQTAGFENMDYLVPTINKEVHHGPSNIQNLFAKWGRWQGRGGCAWVALRQHPLASRAMRCGIHLNDSYMVINYLTVSKKPWELLPWCLEWGKSFQAKCRVYPPVGVFVLELKGFHRICAMLATGFGLLFCEQFTALQLFIRRSWGLWFAQVHAPASIG